MMKKESYTDSKVWVKIKAGEIWQDCWGDMHDAWVGQGRIHKAEVAWLLARKPNISISELARTVGCSRTCAARWKARILSEQAGQEEGNNVL